VKLDNIKRFIVDEEELRKLFRALEEINEARKRLAARYDQTCPERGGDSRPDR
jgi:hypothetical protein